MKRKKYTEAQFIEAVAKATSFRQVLTLIGLREAGGNYQSMKNLIYKLKLDISHFTGQASNKGKIFGPRRPIEDYLSNRQTITSHKLKLRLIQENLLERKCYHCGFTHWLNQLIPLELHHKNGNRLDNQLSNLTLLCPNCHAFTDNYRSKNRKNKSCEFSSALP